MKLRSILPLLALVGCAHGRLDGGDLDRVQRPAYVARLSDDAGPRVDVWRKDATRAATLQGRTPEQADAALREKLAAVLSRFETAERLRSHLAAALAPERPWSNAVPAAQVASALETLLVQEVPAPPPEYGKLKPLGADAVVELVIEEYGLRVRDGRPETFVRGSGRMFRLGDGSELWRSAFARTSTEAKLPALDPAALETGAEPFHAQMVALLDRVSLGLARELSPSDRAGGVPTPAGTDELRAPGDARTPVEREIDRSRQKPSAPPPDATAPTQAPVDDGPGSKGKKKSSTVTPPPDAADPTAVPVDPTKKK